MEQKYLIDIREINQRFESYKKQTQEHLIELQKEKKNLEIEKSVRESKLKTFKSEKRQAQLTLETSQRVFKEKIEKLE